MLYYPNTRTFVCLVKYFVVVVLYPNFLLQKKIMRQVRQSNSQNLHKIPFTTFNIFLLLLHYKVQNSSNLTVEGKRGGGIYQNNVALYKILYCFLHVHTISQSWCTRGSHSNNFGIQSLMVMVFLKYLWNTKASKHFEICQNIYLLYFQRIGPWPILS